MNRTTFFVIGGLAIAILLYLERQPITKLAKRLTGDMKQFIATFLPIATKAAKTFGFPDPYFLLAQMYAENGGSSELLSKANNVGSLVSRDGNGKKLQTNQYWTGNEIPNTKNGL